MKAQVVEKSIRELQAEMAAGTASAEAITLAYLERIAMLDQAGPKLNAVLEINPDAIEIARAMDRERALSGPRGPLHGIPILLKDNISTGDRQHTTAGAEALRNHFARMDAPVVQRLREAGAVLLGKTNLSELARFMTTDIPNGYSAVGGQTLNPYGAALDPMGSSTGSGVAAAMSFCAAAVGTETSGSIIAPSSANGIVGLKPTVGAVSRSGIVPINAQDTAGPMGRTVEDVALLFGAMIGEDAQDPATLCLQGKVHRDYTPFLRMDALRGARLGVLRLPKAGWISQPQLDRYASSLHYLREAGAEVIADVELPQVQPLQKTLTAPVMHYEFKHALDAYFARYGGDGAVRTLHELVRYNNDHRETAAPYGQNILEECDRATTGRLNEAAYLLEKLRAIREAGEEGIDRVLRENGLDALVCPMVSVQAAMCGYPVVNVPCGLAEDGRAIGLSFVAGAWEEGKLLGYAYAFEQLSRLRVTPPCALTGL